MLAADPPVSAAVCRLALVLLAEADFHREILIADDISVAARLVRSHKRETLERVEQLGLIEVEWRGRGRASRAVPRRLGSRPGREGSLEVLPDRNASVTRSGTCPKSLL